jgi:serine/threonine protein kinase
VVNGMNVSSPLRESAKIPGTPYQVVRVVGAGDASYVYEVVHAELGKRFMLKTLEKSGARGEDLVQSLREEWRALAQLDHPNIVRVSDAGVSATGCPSS